MKKNLLIIFLALLSDFALGQGSIAALTCSTATNAGALIRGVAASGVTSSVPYTGGNGGSHSGQTITSTGVTGLTAILAAGTFASGAGNLSYNITGTPATSGTASFALNIGGKTCTLTRTVALPAGTITALTCSTATNTGSLTSGVAASGVSSSVPYTGGNGGSHSGQTVTSTGVTGLTATLVAGTFASGAGNLSYNISGTPASSGTASFALNIGGKTCTLTRTVNAPAGTITAITCSTATNTGTLTSGVAASGVSSSVPYTGGNGGSHSGQTVTSTGVTGLTATLVAGTFASGAGNLSYNISGTPATSGTASFALNIGGKTCSLTRTVNAPAGTITAITCSTATNTGTLTSGVAASGVSSSVPYTGANGGSHSGQTVTSNGVTGLTATLAAGTFASGAGNLTYNITGTPASSGTASFALNIGGKTCTLTRTVALPAGTITALTCSTATNAGTLTSGVAASGVSSSVPYTGGNGGSHSGQTITSTGVSGLTATLAAGTFASGAGNLTYNITGTPASSGTASFALNIGGKTCSLTRTVNAPAGTITALTCSTATNTGTLTSGVAASGVSSSVPYTGGNGGSHSGQTVTSTGVTGLTATLVAGTFASGAGNLTYNISGTPASSGTASFALSIGGKTCSLTRTVNAPAGTITALTCSTATNTATLTSGVAASGVSSSVPYTGGNGGSHSGQTVTSTGVTGLTATLVAGTFASGAGSLTYNISGTPATSGTASFALSLGGQTCTLTRTVNLPAGTITALTCSTATNAGTLTSGVLASGVTSSVPYAGGNGGTYTAQTITSTGVTGLTATLAAGTFAGGAGSLSYKISGTPAAGGTASFALNIGGRTCTLTRTVSSQITGTISSLNCSAGVVSGTILAGIPVNGVTINVPYTGGNGGTYPTQVISSSGATGLSANLAAGNFANGSGNLIFTISGIASEPGSANFLFYIGGSYCSFGFNIGYLSLGCNSSIVTGFLNQGVQASGVSVSIPYSNGIAGLYPAQLINSTSVTGLTATLSAGSLTQQGTFTFTISGTPIASGVANFELAIGQYNSCTFSLPVRGNSTISATCGSTFVHNPEKTYGTLSDQQGNIYNTIVIGSQEWMAENLKTSIYRNGNIVPSVSDSIQWAGLATGACCSYANKSSNDCPGGKLYNWYAVNDARNLCPTGWHIPSIPEWEQLKNYLDPNALGASGKKLKNSGIYHWTIPNTGDNGSGFSALGSGYRYYPTKAFYGKGNYSGWWTSTIFDTQTSLGYQIDDYNNINSEITKFERSKKDGYSIRCLRDVTYSGAITGMNCGSAVHSGLLYAGVKSDGVKSDISYTGGNGGAFSGSVVYSQGVTGLTAIIAAGTFANGSGSIKCMISGTPSASGTATFAINLGGISCVVNRPVESAIYSLNCQNSTNSGTLKQGQPASGASSSIPYSSLASGTFGSKSFPSEGVTGLTATINSSVYNNFSGNLNFTFSGTPASSGLASFTISMGGQTCVLNRIVDLPQGTVASLSCTNPQNTGTLNSGTAASNSSSTFSYSGGNGGVYSGQTVFSTGVTGLSAILSPDTFNLGSGNLTYQISGIPSTSSASGTGVASFAINIGGKTCTINRNVNLYSGTITELRCTSAANSGTLIPGIPASGVSSTIPYLGGNGGAYSNFSISSRGVTGLTANLAPGSFATGSGNLTFAISGTPSETGSAIFDLSIGGKTCMFILSVNGSVGSSASACGAGSVHNPNLVYGLLSDQEGNKYKTIVIGSQEWMAENLRTSIYRNGDPISLVVSGWSEATQGAWIHNNANSSYNCPFGKLYNSYAVADSRNVCPAGWKIPEMSDWTMLESQLGSAVNNGGLIKSAGTQYWASPNIGALNFSGFSALPGGFISSNGSSVPIPPANGNLEPYAAWWSSSNAGIQIQNYSPSLDLTNPITGNGYGFSVRCMRDIIPTQTTISAINCASATHNGVLNACSEAVGVSSIISYSGGNGGNFSELSFSSTGVTGLTARLAAGTIATGSGTLILTITGIPSGSGNASFAISFGGQTCTLSRTVFSGPLVTTLNCAAATYSGYIVCDDNIYYPIPAGVYVTVQYTGGNGGAYPAQTALSTGARILATLPQGNLSIGSGSITYTISGMVRNVSQPTTASVPVNLGCSACTLNVPVYPKGIVLGLACSSAVHSGVLTNGFAASSVSSVVSYTTGNGGYIGNMSFASTGVTGLTASVSEFILNAGSGSFTVSITGTPASSGTASFLLSIGSYTCTLTRTVYPQGSVSALNCSTATNSGILTQGSASSNVSSIVPYSGGNGGAYASQTIFSTGVLGLSASLNSGILASGNGSLTFAISGTPSTSGIANFAINIGGKTCTLARTVYPIGTVTGFNLAATTSAGTLTQGSAASAVTSTISYTGGNGGTYVAQTVTSTGVSGLTASLVSGIFANGAGTVTYSISGTTATSGTASFVVNLGGQSTILTRTVFAVGSITALNCASAGNSGTLTQGFGACGVSSVVSYTGGNGGTYSAQSIASTGVTGLTATLPQGILVSGSGGLVFTISGTPSSSGTANFALNIGGRTCVLSRTVNQSVSIGQSYQGGTVVYIFKPGDGPYDPCLQKGIIAAVPLGGNSNTWGCYNYDIFNLSYALGSGANNTQLIVNQGCGGAALYCSNLVYNGYSDWSLPSADELISIYQTKNLTGIPPYNFWSSTQVLTGSYGCCSPNVCLGDRFYHAHNVNFSNNNGAYLCYGLKGNIANVLPIRYFGISGLLVRNAVSAGINERGNDDLINLNPNPANTEVSLEISSAESEDCRIEITDMLGRVLLEENRNLQPGANVLSYDIRDFRNGIYLVRVLRGSSRKVYRLVKN